MYGFMSSLPVGGSGAAGFVWPQHLFLLTVFLSPKPSTLVWRFDPGTALMRRWHTPAYDCGLCLFKNFSGMFWQIDPPSGRGHQYLTSNLELPGFPR
jgi:hypothetical protein